MEYRTFMPVSVLAREWREAKRACRAKVKRARVREREAQAAADARSQAEALVVLDAWIRETLEAEGARLKTAA